MARAKLRSDRHSAKRKEHCLAYTGIGKERVGGLGGRAYSPPGRGFLSGKIRSLDDLDPSDWRRQNPRFQGENLEKNLALADRIREIAGKKGCTPAQPALAWVLAQGRDVVPIPGTRSPQRLAENAASTAMATLNG
jgi:aryl-alcohol dehydrogenase-like predicted oxidoreductase